MHKSNNMPATYLYFVTALPTHYC